MHSPLPDSSALEAGILEDEYPSRLSGIQDNVRHLLRSSMLGSVASFHSAPTQQTIPPATRQQHVEGPLLPLHSISNPQIDPSPNAAPSMTPTTVTSHSPTERPVATAIPLPGSYQQMNQHIAHQSALFNNRAVEALHHPDLNDPSLLQDFSKQKAQQRERRALRKACKHQRRVIRNVGRSQGFLCIISAVLLAALVATYLALVMTSSGSISTTFHVLFIIGILLATILFAHSMARLCVLPGSRSHQRHRNQYPRWYVGGRPPRQRRHHHHHHQHRRRELPPLTTDAYVPPTPIQVHLASDVPSSAEPTAPAAPTNEQHDNDWNKDTPTVANPPPAYGRWRNSVRANPDLLHWQAIPMPSTPNLPSPTYDEATAAAPAAASFAAALLHGEASCSETSPPSYVTKESPERRRDVQEARVIQSQVIVPEMVEIRRGNDTSSPVSDFVAPYGGHAVSSVEVASDEGKPPRPGVVAE